MSEGLGGCFAKEVCVCAGVAFSAMVSRVYPDASCQAMSIGSDTSYVVGRYAEFGLR